MMKNWIFLLITFILFTSCSKHKINVADYGLFPDTKEDAMPILKKILYEVNGKSNVEIIFPKGRYDFFEENCLQKEYFESNTTDNNPKNLCFLFEKMKNVTLDGNGSMFMFHGRVQPITVEECQRVNMRNFSIDFEIPTSAEGVVTEVKPDYYEVTLDSTQFPYHIEDGRLYFWLGTEKCAYFTYIEFDADRDLIEPRSGDKGWGAPCTVSSTQKNVLRFTSNEPHRFPKKGNVIVLRHGDRDHSGIFLLNSSDIIIENVNIHQTAAHGVLGQYSKNLTFKNCNVVPNTERGRKYLSSHDDGFHLMGCSGEILIDSCQWIGLMDDPVNVHGTCVKIMKVLGPNKLQCTFMHEQATGMIWGNVGDRVGFINNDNLNTVGYGVIKEYKQVSIDEFELVFENHFSNEVYEGGALENLSCTPNLTIRNSYFGPCRARGLLVSTPGKVVIENNRFRSSGSAILIAGDANQWYESGAVKDVLIQNNVFEYPCLSSLYQFCEAIISIYPEIPSLDPDLPYHENIRIVNNKFYAFDEPILYAKSVNGLVFSDNIIIKSREIEPFHYNKEPFKIIGCLNVEIENNVFMEQSK